MNLKQRLLARIGMLGGFVGFLVLTYAPLSGLLPINQVLFALVCALLVIWALVALTKKLWGERRW